MPLVELSARPAVQLPLEPGWAILFAVAVLFGVVVHFGTVLPGHLRADRRRRHPPPPKPDVEPSPEAARTRQVLAAMIEGLRPDPDERDVEAAKERLVPTMSLAVVFFLAAATLAVWESFGPVPRWAQNILLPLGALSLMACCLLSWTVTRFNRPKWIVVPGLRDQPGLRQVRRAAGRAAAQRRRWWTGAAIVAGIVLVFVLLAVLNPPRR